MPAPRESNVMKGLNISPSTAASTTVNADGDAWRLRARLRDAEAACEAQRRRFAAHQTRLTRELALDMDDLFAACRAVAHASIERAEAAVVRAARERDGWRLRCEAADAALVETQHALEGLSAELVVALAREAAAREAAAAAAASRSAGPLLSAFETRLAAELAARAALCARARAAERASARYAREAGRALAAAQQIGRAADALCRLVADERASARAAAAEGAAVARDARAVVRSWRARCDAFEAAALAALATGGGAERGAPDRRDGGRVVGGGGGGGWAGARAAGLDAATAGRDARRRRESGHGGEQRAPLPSPCASSAAQGRADGGQHADDLGDYRLQQPQPELQPAPQPHPSVSEAAAAELATQLAGATAELARAATLRLRERAHFDSTVRRLLAELETARQGEARAWGQAGAAHAAGTRDGRAHSGAAAASARAPPLAVSPQHLEAAAPSASPHARGGRAGAVGAASEPRSELDQSDECDGSSDHEDGAEDDDDHGGDDAGRDARVERGSDGELPREDDPTDGGSDGSASPAPRPFDVERAMLLSSQRARAYQQTVDF
jgi:hypothetical protein